MCIDLSSSVSRGLVPSCDFSELIGVSPAGQAVRIPISLEHRHGARHQA